MSKSSKMRRKLNRKKDKQKRRAANRALYEKLRDEGRNSKSKRAVKNARGTVIKDRVHPDRCGNPACRRCYPAFHAMLIATGRTRPNGKVREGVKLWT